MTTRVVLLSDLRENKYYNVITFGQGIRMKDIMLGKINNKYIKSTVKLGKLIKIQQYGRLYDPDINLIFMKEDGSVINFTPPFGSIEGYSEYEYDTEDMSKTRILERTSILKYDILGNDWALRPENVVATQGIDISNFSR
jgi:hypothetical protein